MQMQNCILQSSLSKVSSSLEEVKKREFIYQFRLEFEVS